MEFLEYITENALVLIPVLSIIGAILKNTPIFPDWCIPWALLIISVVISVFMFGWTADGVVQGILVAGSAVFGNQLIKQTIERDAGSEK